MHAELCPVCHGTGWYEPLNRECHGCDGDGWIEVHDNHEYVPCPFECDYDYPNITADPIIPFFGSTPPW